MASKVIKLSQRYEVHGAAFDAITMREPTGADYWALGPIAETQPGPNGGIAVITFHDKKRDYAERLINLDAGALAVLNLADTLKVEQAVTDFFIEARSSNKPSTSSSGEPASRSEASSV